MDKAGMYIVRYHHEHGTESFPDQEEFSFWKNAAITVQESCRISFHPPKDIRNRSRIEQTITLFAYADIWLMLMLMLKCCERKILFHG
jgi:hypothetical protein